MAPRMPGCHVIDDHLSVELGRVVDRDHVTKMEDRNPVGDLEHVLRL